MNETDVLAQERAWRAQRRATHGYFSADFASSAASRAAVLGTIAPLHARTLLGTAGHLSDGAWLCARTAGLSSGAVGAIVAVSRRLPGAVSVGTAIAAGVGVGLLAVSAAEEGLAAARKCDDAWNAPLAGFFVGYVAVGTMLGARNAVPGAIACGVGMGAFAIGADAFALWKRRTILRERGLLASHASPSWQLPEWMPIKRSPAS